MPLAVLASLFLRVIARCSKQSPVFYNLHFAIYILYIANRVPMRFCFARLLISAGNRGRYFGNPLLPGKITEKNSEKNES
jgi:hypothetical protein